MNVGDSVVLKSFLGEVQSLKGTKESEDYWILIGSKGKIIDKKQDIHPYYPKNGYQVLVLFDAVLDELGLINHNKTPNTLWIFESDLEVVKI